MVELFFPATINWFAAAPKVRLPVPPGVTDKLLLLCRMGVVTLVVKVGLLVMLTVPAADKLRLPVAAIAKVPLAFGTVIVRFPVRVAGLKAAVKPSTVPSLKASCPRLVVLPIVKPVAPCTFRFWKVGLDEVAISWMVFTKPAETLKLVLLNWAIPLAAVLALSMVMLPPDPVALLSVTLPVWLLID